MKKLDPLREELKGHFIALMDHLIGHYRQELALAQTNGDLFRASSVRKVLKVYETANMRQMWKLTCIYKRALMAGTRQKDPEPRHRLEIALWLAGVRYYGAKDPQIKQQFIMERLTQP